MDDASDDGSLETIKTLIAGDKRIDLIARPSRGGPQAARQTGFESSSAKYVATLDSDDLWSPTKLERQLNHFASEARALPDLGVVLCWHQWIDIRPRGQLTEPVTKPQASGWAGPLISANMSTPLMLRSSLEAAGGFLPADVHSLLTCEGHEFYIRLTEAAPFAVVAEKLVICRHHVRGGRPINYFGLEGPRNWDMSSTFMRIDSAVTRMSSPRFGHGSVPSTWASGCEGRGSRTSGPPSATRGRVVLRGSSGSTDPSRSRRR